MRTSLKIQRGSITLVALSLAIVIAISLASYIALCNQSLLLSTRSVQIGRARQLAETGLEEALWGLNTGANPDPTIAATAWKISPTVPTVAAGSDPWVIAWPDRSCTITGYDFGEGATGQLDISIQNYYGDTPTIKVIASVTVSGLGTFTKTLTATTKPAPLFANAVGIINGHNGSVILNNGGLVDSWDSDYLGYTPLGSVVSPAPNRDYVGSTTYPGSVPSTLFTSPTTPSPYLGATASPSTYPDLSFNYAAVVAAPNITLNGAEIRGYAETFGNPITIASSSTIAAPPPAPGTPPSSPSIDQTRVGKSAFVPSFTVAAPTGAAFGPIDGSQPLLDNSGGSAPKIWDASPTDLTLDAQTVTIKGHVIIRVPGDLSLKNGGHFVIFKPVSPDLTQGQLEIFVGGNVTIDSNISSGFQNDKYEPKNLSLYSMNTGARTFLYYSPRDFCGVIYSASTISKVEFRSSPIIYGAILANYNIEFTGVGAPQIHYDTALQYLPKGWFKGVTTPYMIVQVTETP